MSDVLSHEELSISYCTDTDVKGSSADYYVELSVHGFSISKAIRIISKESLESVEPLFGQQRLCWDGMDSGGTCYKTGFHVVQLWQRNAFLYGS